MAVTIGGRDCSEESAQEILDQAWSMFDLYDQCLELLEVDELPRSLHDPLFEVLRVRARLGIAEKHERRILKGMK